MRTSLHIADVRFFCAVLLLALVSTAGITSAADDSLDLGEYRGKVVIVDFWASWCVPCRRSFPWLNRMQRKYAGDGLVIVGVNVDKNPDDAKAFLEEYRAQFRIVSDPNGEIAEKFDVIAMPSSYVIGRDGGIVDRHLGFKVKKQGEYEAVIRETLEST